VHFWLKKLKINVTIHGEHNVTFNKSVLFTGYLSEPRATGEPLGGKTLQ
jgi:hypothetical protein